MSGYRVTLPGWVSENIISWWFGHSFTDGFSAPILRANDGEIHQRRHEIGKGSTSDDGRRGEVGRERRVESKLRRVSPDNQTGGISLMWEHLLFVAEQGLTF
jgi:hypothetical protein